MPEPKRSSTTVTIASKSPFDLRVPIPGRPPLTIHGYNGALEANGVGLTHGVPVDVWTSIQMLYVEAPWLKNGFVFASDNLKDIESEKNEKEPLKNTLEPLDPDKEPSRISRTSL